MRSLARPVLATLGTLLLAACSADSSVAPGTLLSTTTVNANLAVVSAAAVGDQIAAIGGGNTGAGVSFYTAPQGSSSLVMPSAVAVGCTGPNAQGWFICIKWQERGLNVTRAFRFWSGGAVAGGPSNSTDSLQHLWLTSGRDTVTVGTATRIRSVLRADTGTSVIARDATPAKNPTQFTNNGHGSVADTMIFSDSGKVVTMTYAGHTVVTNVVRKAPEASNPFPFSGTISLQLDVNAKAVKGDKTETRAISTTAVVTFNGTQTASLAVGTQTCDLNLVTRRASNCR